MARPPSRSAEDKVRVVLAVLRGEVTIAEAARREGVSQTSIANWRDQFLDGVSAGSGRRRGGQADEPRAPPRRRERTARRRLG